MRFLLEFIAGLELCNASGFEEIAGAIKPHSEENPDWKMTKNLITEIQGEILTQDQNYADAITDTESVESAVSSRESHTYPELLNGFSENIPIEFVGRSDQEIVGEYELRDLVTHDEAHLMIGTHAIMKSPKFIFKYQFNCFANIWNKQFCKRKKKSEACLYATRNPEALIEEYIFTRVAYERLKLAPKPILISPPVAVTEESLSTKSGKMNFSIFNDQSTTPTDCVEFGTTVRLLVEELVGPTIADYFDQYTREEKAEKLNIESIRLAAKVFKQSISMLRRLHSIGIVHGDFHNGNLAFRFSEFDVHSDPLDLVFIDFGTAKFFPDDIDKPYHVSAMRYYFFSTSLLSPFQIDGHIMGRRDDIYRAYESFMNLLTQGNLERLFEKPINASIDYLKWELDFNEYAENFGKYPGLNFLRELVDQEKLNAIHSYLSEIQNYVRNGQTSVFVEPDYEYLLERARGIETILSQEFEGSNSN